MKIGVDFGVEFGVDFGVKFSDFFFQSIEFSTK